MSFFDKIYDIAHTDLLKYVFHSGSDKEFVANVSKISTVNENLLDSKWTLTAFSTCAMFSKRDAQNTLQN